MFRDGGKRTSGKRKFYGECFPRNGLANTKRIAFFFSKKKKNTQWFVTIGPNTESKNEYFDGIAASFWPIREGTIRTRDVVNGVRCAYYSAYEIGEKYVRPRDGGYVRSKKNGPFRRTFSFRFIRSHSRARAHSLGRPPRQTYRPFS